MSVWIRKDLLSSQVNLNLVQFPSAEYPLSPVVVVLTHKDGDESGYGNTHLDRRLLQLLLYDLSGGLRAERRGSFRPLHACGRARASGGFRGAGKCWWERQVCMYVCV